MKHLEPRCARCHRKVAVPIEIAGMPLGRTCSRIVIEEARPAAEREAERAQRQREADFRAAQLALIV